ncbi:Metallo-hydrolase/oxidoreductase [Microthyrium microscopicum]|uniref:Metallo-hydrolase/oxidoreductase n=1 Tax=Microthyrium microscopicum TaxID=703497 RepID=A0A6A6TUD9_9PEZI|nr:Metallo-hydrolase/oxidoreductase [Microthyrium microscopicum]
MASASTAALLYASAISTSQILGAQPEEAADRKHHAQGGKSFVNPWESYRDQGVWEIVKALVWRRIRGQANSPDTAPPTVPIREPQFHTSREETKALRATWLGHACFYVEFPNGLRVLFDPVFEDRCSPFSFLGPKRYTEPPCQIEDIPIIDAVVISHSHYDHLSYPTVLKIKEKHPNCQFFAPLGNKAWFEKCGIRNSTELDWWENRELKLTRMQAMSGSEELPTKVVEAGSQSGPAEISATIGCLPCQHTAARTPFDKAKTLWASWMVESGGKKVWFAGDTGYRTVPEVPNGEDDYGEKYKDLPHCPAFKEIGKHRGPFDLGMIPIGAYDPRFIMSPVHANPFDSANIFVDSNCKKALGMHWGTWVLTEEDVMEPPKLLKAALKQKGIDEIGVFDVCDIGESREF